MASLAVLWHVLVSNSFAFIAMFRLSGNNLNTPNKSLAWLQSFCSVGCEQIGERRRGSAGLGERISSQMG